MSVLRSAASKEDDSASVVWSDIGILILLGIFSPARQSSDSPPSKGVIHPGVFKTFSTLTIRNDDNFDWLSAKVFINGIMLGYSAEIGPVSRGEKKTVNLRDFTKKNGERFNPQVKRPTEVIVHVPG